MFHFCLVLVSSDKIPSPSGNNWIIGNLKYLGYFLVNYDERNWNAIIDQLKTDPTVSYLDTSGIKNLGPVVQSYRCR